jgi:hypothetical protein
MNKQIWIVAMLALAVSLTGCTKKEDEMGPAQKAGAAIDNAGDRVAKDIHEKLDKARDAGQDVAEAAKVQGEAIKEATAEVAEEAGKKVEEAGKNMQEAARKK